MELYTVAAFYDRTEFGVPRTRPLEFSASDIMARLLSEDISFLVEQGYEDEDPELGGPRSRPLAFNLLTRQIGMTMPVMRGLFSSPGSGDDSVLYEIRPASRLFVPIPQQNYFTQLTIYQDGFKERFIYEGESGDFRREFRDLGYRCDLPQQRMSLTKLARLREKQRH
jgi:hypothetical protein